MNKVIYIAGGLVLVVVVAAFGWRPPQDSSDVAGWVQAFGAIVAVALAVWLQYEARIERVQQASLLATAFAYQVVRCADEMQFGMRNATWEKYFQFRTLLENWAQTEVPLADLPPNKMAMVITIRSIAITTLATAPVTNTGSGWQHWDTAFGNFAHDCRSVINGAGVQVPEKGFSP